MQTAHTIRATNPTIKFTDGSKISAEQKAYVWSLAMHSTSVTSRRILEQNGSLSISVRHLNRIRKELGCSRKTGRPQTDDNIQPANPGSLVRLDSNLKNIGIHVFACRLEDQPVFTEILNRLRYAIQDHIMNHPVDSFPLLRHRDETLIRLFKALFFAPLFGIGKLIEYDYKEHALRTVIGRGYQSSTLNQYLEQLERIDAGPKLMSALLPAKMAFAILTAI